jgi:hypothetical protein
MDIAPEIARKLLNRDFANLAQRVQRVQRGGKLNRAERKNAPIDWCVGEVCLHGALVQLP